MNRCYYHLLVLLLVVSLVLLLGCRSPQNKNQESAALPSQVHYLEIVSHDLDKVCRMLEEMLGVTFGEKVASLGMARVAKMPGGQLLGVRAPLAAHELPIVRTYFRVDDIQKALKTAESAGAEIAYPPTQQGNTGTWAIFILNGIQYGLWQQ